MSVDISEDKWIICKEVGEQFHTSDCRTNCNLYNDDNTCDYAYDEHQKTLKGD